MDNVTNYIVCPKCQKHLYEKDATFKQTTGTTFYTTCSLCGHVWIALAQDFKRDRGTDPNRNPFDPINITPRW